MRLTLRILPRPASVPVLSLDPAIAAAIDPRSGLIETDSTSPLFRRIVERAPDTAGMWVNPVGSFSRQEIESCAWLQLELRGKIITETRAERAANDVALQHCPLFQARPGALVRLPHGLALSRLKIRPNEIGGATDWLSEWVVPDGVTQVFTAAGLTGWSVKPLHAVRQNSPVPGFGQLFTEVMLPPARIDRT
ncbi:MAG: hypothetical protein JNG84_01450, partial [Archangium sp.]|nr:hypothetical protein [Archangium sp.]